MSPVDFGHGAQILQDDAADRQLLSLVHPPDWKNPTPKPRYHLVVIGAGTGGLVTAAAAAGLGARVALIERHLMGGDCLNVGCVPSKGILSAARSWHAARRAAPDFHGPRVVGVGNFTDAMARMRRLRAGLAPVDSAARFRELGVDVFLGAGRFSSPTTIAVGNATLRFRRAVIASGARAAVPPIPGLAESAYLTNESVFTLTERPARMAVIGAGPIGCELAQAFQRLGVEVTVFGREDRVLPRDDREAADLVAASLRADGVRLTAGAAIQSVERIGSVRRINFSVGGSQLQLDVDQILVAAGRQPNVEDVGLEQAGIEYSSRGVSVSDRLQTSNRRVYAVGDVCSPYQFTHAADFQARLVVQNALFLGRGRASRLVVPWCTYTAPELAQVGLTEAQAAAAGTPVDVVSLGFEHLDRAVLDGETAGMVKLVLARGTDRIVGATVVAAHAGDLIGELTVAMTNGLGLGAIGRSIHPYPTQAEILRKAADQWRRRKLTPRAKWILAKWFALWDR